MKRASAVAVGLLTLFLFTAPVAAAKGRTLKITIKGGSLTKEFASPGVEQFGVWEGPGVRVNGVEQTEGFIIDWPKGTVANPLEDLQKYEVSFYTDWRYTDSRSKEPLLTYVVTYVYDPATQT